MIETLVAGRELDALVAEKVMDFPIERFPEDGYSIMRVPGTNWAAVETEYGIARYTEFLPAFSTDIAAAWEVLNRIHSQSVERDQFWPFSKRSLFYHELEKLCVVVDGDKTFEVAWPDALGIFRDRIPEFICLAALKAVEK